MSPTFLYKPVPSFGRQGLSALSVVESTSRTSKAIVQGNTPPTPKTPSLNICKVLVPLQTFFPTESANEILGRSEHIQLSLQSPPPVEIPSEDGYNWRKYGQKSVKNTGYSRSYYRCAHANCPVKKIVEQSNVVIKGEHDHPKPQAIRRLPTGASPTINKSGRDGVGGGPSKADSLSCDNITDALSIKGQLPNCSSGTTQSSSSTSTDCDEGVEIVRSKRDEGDGATRNREDVGYDDDHEFKNRKKQKAGDAAAKLTLRSIREPRVVVQTTCDADIVDDGYRWCKYGQKLIKGKAHPRSYYKCHNSGCPVRKHVERSSTDANTVISTYEGKHNHEMPASRINGHTIAGSIITAITLPPVPDSAPTMSNSNSTPLQSQLSKGRPFADIVNGDGKFGSARHADLSFQQHSLVSRQLEDKGDDRSNGSEIAMSRALSFSSSFLHQGKETTMPVPLSFSKPGVEERSAFQKAEPFVIRPKIEPDEGKSDSTPPNKFMISTLTDCKPYKIVP